MGSQRSHSSSTTRSSHSGSGHFGNSHSKSKPRLVGRYELGCTLGQGSFAKVKLARDVKTMQQVAIKVMEKEKILQRNMADQNSRQESSVCECCSRVVEHKARDRGDEDGAPPARRAPHRGDGVTEQDLHGARTRRRRAALRPHRESRAPSCLC
ncbi:unnamed protein product [Closterium sp. NIES-54]